MSILRESPLKIGFDARLEQSSKSYQNLSRVSIRNFEVFTKAECEGKNAQETFDYIKAMSEDKREPMLFHVFQTWINKLTETSDPTTVKNYFGVVKKLARHYGFKISDDDVKEKLTFAKKIKDTKYVLTLDDIYLILKDSSWRKKGFYLFLLSSGVRPREALSIRKKDITLLSNGRYLIKLPAQITKLKIERETFVSKEVYPYIAKILREKEDNDLIWTGQKKADYAVITADTTFRELCNRIGLIQKYENVNRRKLNLYCFRGFFYAKASRKHGDEYAHKMIGHTGYLPVYDRKTLDERLAMYEEYESELITDQIQKLKIENDKLKVKDEEIKLLKEDQDSRYNSFFQKETLKLKQQSEATEKMRQDIDKTLELENRNRRDLDKILEGKKELNDFVKVLAEHIKTGKRPDDHRFDKQLDVIKDLVTDESNTDESKLNNE